MIEVRHPRTRYRTVTIIEGDSRTETSHAEATDINFIVNRFARTGQLPPPRREPFYGDVTGLQGDLTERLEWANQIIGEAVQYQKAQEASKASSSQGGTPPATEPPTGSSEPA